MEEQPRRRGETLRINSVLRYFIRLRNKIDDLLKGDRVECEVCGELLINLGMHISRKHNITIDQYKVLYPDALTIAPNLLKILSDSQMGRVVSDETRLKIVVANTGRKHTDKARKNMSDAHLGHRPTEETLKKMSESQLGRHHTGEAKRKISDAHRGRKHTEETKNKNSEGHKGKVASIETRKKMSDAAKAKPPVSEETLKRMSDAQIGKKHSDDTRINMSCAQQGVSRDEWCGFISETPYCDKFDEECRESNRNKYYRCCFLCGVDEEENRQKLSVHHVDLNKDQGCNDHKWKLIPLCRKCHGRAHTKIWKARIIWMLDNI